jgi:hypothetical protein
MKKSLESSFTSRNLNKWIDLIFGTKVCGDMDSSFSKRTHGRHVPKSFGSQVWEKEKIHPLEDAVLEAALLEHGLCPQVIFFAEHPARQVSSVCLMSNAMMIIHSN